MKNPYIRPFEDWVTVWLGDLSPAELESYINEPGGVETSEISEFAKDIGAWYDHDYIISCANDESVSCEDLCKLAHFEILPVECNPTEEILKRAGSKRYKSLLLLYNYKLNSEADMPASVFAGGRLKCVGSWEQVAPLI